MAKLAINGGKKVREEKFPPYLPIGNEELEQVKNVFGGGIFSRFLGAWHEDFYGGEQVRSLEREWSEYFGVKHAVAVNSATSALYCTVGAVGTEPFDEIIVTPYSMSCSATAPLIYNAIPVFADVEPEYFCLDAKSVESKITDKT
ncbi:MAG: DegT/DnrJ/EryC1/StrS family aminotransferase, partial [Oscillospiraceae bacterium]|nr:DegT/DnrJ/EryC1/StrS family aminotransferase [Oscillospiraceae bacterium]